MNEIENFLAWCEMCGHYMVLDLYRSNYLKYLARSKELTARVKGEVKNDET